MAELTLVVLTRSWSVTKTWDGTTRLKSAVALETPKVQEAVVEEEIELASTAGATQVKIDEDPTREIAILE